MNSSYNSSNSGKAHKGFSLADFFFNYYKSIKNLKNLKLNLKLKITVLKIKQYGKYFDFYCT